MGKSEDVTKVVAEFLASKNVSVNCSKCGSVNHGVMQDQTFIKAGQRNIPATMTVCGNCGHVEFYLSNELEESKSAALAE